MFCYTHSRRVSPFSCDNWYWVSRPIHTFFVFLGGACVSRLAGLSKNSQTTTTHVVVNSKVHNVRAASEG
ncbi:hypothetical protein FCULG_00010233 [Fusarium culmorum]|uniref:Uncharacterized protein n=1 Tax=Fusarium culmorum TaxID=5516 RepID=A0A2T4GEI1_FUSCU|nr:hypothetical protein FCULG_00010233 [Fusarium culmorum]